MISLPLLTMDCFGIEFEHIMIPRWLRRLYTSACGSDDLTDWDHSPDCDDRRLYSSWNANVLASNAPRSERNDAKMYLDTEPSSCGYRPNSSGGIDRKMPQIPTPPNSPQTPDSVCLAYAPSWPRMPALLEMRKDQPLPTTTSCTPSPEGTGDTSVIPSNSKWFQAILKINSY